MFSVPQRYIEQTFLNILSEIEKFPFGQPKISLKRIVCDSLSSSQQITEREITYCWPGKNREEAWRFACVGKILAEIYDALQNGVTITKRDVYYRDPELYGKQVLVDRYVDDIAYTCNVTRRELNVTASAKGLHAGLPLRYSQNNGSSRSFETVPDSVSHMEVHRLDHLDWILVVEKEVRAYSKRGVSTDLDAQQATFRSLVEKEFHGSSTNGRGLLVTAKGYPDLSTRRFLRFICDHTASTSQPCPPILGLFDADPDGINIMQIYRQGSHSLPHEHTLNLSEMKWLGVRAEDILAGLRDDEAVLRLTARDRRKAVAMLEKLSQEDGSRIDEQCNVELQRMLQLNIKAEIQILEDRPDGLQGWLDSKMRKYFLRTNFDL